MPVRWRSQSNECLRGAAVQQEDEARADERCRGGG